MVVAAPLYYSSGTKAKISEGSDTKAIEQMRCGVMKWWCENGRIECEGFFKDRTKVDDTWTELDENELLSPSNASAVFIKEFCLTIFYAFLGIKLSSYIFDVWL